MLDSFLVTIWLASKSAEDKQKFKNEAKALISEVQTKQAYGFHQITDALATYKDKMSGGKLFLKPSLTE